jgi:uncharacterized protein (TIGR02246 family)
MTIRTATIAAGALLTAACLVPAAAAAAAGDVAQIKALEARFAAAFNAKDVDAIMRVYESGARLVVFDVVPPRQYVGAAAYRKDWQDFFATLKGPVKFTISDLAIAADRNLAYSHSIQRVVGTDKNGKPIDLTVRLTDVYRKVDGHWLIEHEHVSVPVDLDTDKPDLASKP